MDIFSIFFVDLPQLISTRMKGGQDREREAAERDRRVEVTRQYDSAYRFTELAFLQRKRVLLYRERIFLYRGFSASRLAFRRNYE